LVLDMYRVDESKCIRCGLCILECPGGAFRGRGEHKVRHSTVYEEVWIDSGRCIECGMCVDEPYWCPASAVYREGTARAEEALGDGAKYARYIYHYDVERDSYFQHSLQQVEEYEPALFERIGSHLAELPWKWVTRLDEDIMPGSQFYIVRWTLPHAEPTQDVGHPPHIHRDAELLFVIGSDPENPQELGAEIEFCLGPELERHIINKTCVIYIPPRFIHGPWRELRTDRPWLFIEVNQGPRHTEKTYNQLLPPEAVERDDNLDIFIDKWPGLPKLSPPSGSEG